MEPVEIDWLQHESVGAGLKNPFFVGIDPADRDDRRLVGGVRLDAAADFNAVDAGQHDIEDQQIRFNAADFNQGSDAVRRSSNFVAALALKKRLDQALDDVDDDAQYR